MVEGSAVDGGGHTNNAVRNVGEYFAFDAACKVAIEFAKERNDTIVVVAPDHDTGGLSYRYSDIDRIVRDIQSGTNSPLVKWETGGHTARNGGVFMYLPEGVPYPAGIDLANISKVSDEFYNAYGNFSATYPANSVNVIDNIDIVKYIALLIEVDFDELSDKLFVDVTDRGTYDPTSEVFKFSDADIEIKRNSSTASVYGLNTDLYEEIALYIEGRFYVPSKVFTVGNQIKNGFYIYADYNTGSTSYSGKIGIGNAWVSSVITKPNVNLNNDVKKSYDELNVVLSGFDLDEEYPGLIIAAQYADGKLTSANCIPVIGGGADFGREIAKNNHRYSKC